MGTILFAWELGGGSGHLTRIAPLAKALRANGHTVYLASKNLVSVESLFAGTGVQYLQCPVFQAANSSGFREPASYAHIAHNVGFGSDTALHTLAGAWRNLYRLIKPDLIVLDHSPMALLATRGMAAKVVLVGSGFSIPPDVYPLPALRPNRPYNAQRLRADENIILDRINRELVSWGQSPLLQLGRLFSEVDSQFLTTFRELDHYPNRSDGNYCGPINAIAAGGKEPVWPKGNGPLIYAYLKQFSTLPSLLNALKNSRFPTLIHCDGIASDIRRQYESETLRFETERLDLRQAANHCDLAITNGTLATTSMMLMAGKPLLMLPIVLEQGILSRTVQSLGAGICVSLHEVPTRAEKFSALIADVESCRGTARGMQAIFSGFDPVMQVKKVINRLEELLGSQKSIAAPVRFQSRRVVLLIRRSRTYWLEGRIEALDILPQRKAELAKAAIDWWDKTFAMSYAEFRRRNQQIVQTFYLEAKFDQIIPWLDLEAIANQPAGTWLVPVDEDDWIDPALPEHIRSLGIPDSAKLITWDVVRRNVNGTSGTNPNPFIESCGYAIVLPSSRSWIENHMALGTADSGISCGPTHHIPTVLAIRNQTPASLGFLVQTPLLEIFQHMHRGTQTGGMDLPNHFMPVCLQYQKLIQELEGSRGCGVILRTP